MCSRDDSPDMHDTEYAAAATHVPVVFVADKPIGLVVRNSSYTWPPDDAPVDTRRIDVMRVLGCLICLGSALAFVGLAWIALAAAGLV